MRHLIQANLTFLTLALENLIRWEFHVLSVFICWILVWLYYA